MNVPDLRKQGAQRATIAGGLTVAMLGLVARPTWGEVRDVETRTTT